MARRYTARRVRTHLVYTVWEVAELLGCHRQTVIRWVRDKGLVADTEQRPWLIEGRDLKAFLGQMAHARKRKLARHEFFCFGCQDARTADGRIADYIVQTATTGMLRGLCPDCGALLNKVVRRADLHEFRAKLDVTIQQAQPRLVSSGDPLVNVTFEQEPEIHGKTQQK